MGKSIEVVIDINDFIKPLEYPDWEATVKERLAQAGIPISYETGEYVLSGVITRLDDPCDFSKTKYVWTPE